MFSLCFILNGWIFRNILSRTSCFFDIEWFFLLEASKGILSIKNSARDMPNSCASRASNQLNMILSFPRLFVFFNRQVSCYQFFLLLWDETRHASLWHRKRCGGQVWSA